MRILSIETSCDDTGVTIFEVKGGTTDATFKVLADNLASQTKIHTKYGGVYPMLAKREHIKNLPILLEKSLKEANLPVDPVRGRGALRALATSNGIDLIAVTYGPGLEPSLWTGITFAQDLAKKWKVPVIPVNHMEGHVLSVFGKHKPARPNGRSGGGKFKIKKLKTPILSLLVSGGHTQLVLSKKWMQYEIIGETKDDAVGEAFDKVARMLGLPYPGGPHISKLAEELRASQVHKNSAALPSLRGLRHGQNFSAPVSLPRPMMYTKDFNFSFSGLKTAVLYLIRKIDKLDEKTKMRIALEFENAAIECLVYKTAKAIEKYKIKTLIVAGGVAANKHLRNEIKKITGRKVKLLISSHELSRDNSIMIGIAGYLNYIKNKRKVGKPEDIKATGNLRL